MPSFSLLLTLAVIALHTTLVSARPIDNSGNAYGGKGGYASGGNVTSPEKGKNLLSSLGLDKALVNLKSGNAGHGGQAGSGTALGGLAPNLDHGHLAGIGGSNSGNAYSKDGGVADGGSVQGTNDALINIDSNNAGHGGAASSGSAIGSSDSGWKDDHGDERDGDYKDWDDDHEDHDHEDSYHEDDYEEEDYENYVDRKRHERHLNGENCDC